VLKTSFKGIELSKVISLFMKQTSSNGFNLTQCTLDRRGCCSVVGWNPWSKGPSSNSN